MTVELIVIAAVLLLGGGAAAFAYVYRQPWFRSKTRMIESTVLGVFIRVWPNPGFAIRGFHWCKARGWHKPFRPRKLGLKPGVRAAEGTPLFNRRMEYLRRGE
jgi:hypothetical protein